MRYLICVDDTDDLTKETSTGKIANLIAKDLFNNFDVKLNKGVTRHQLLLKEGIPYTSHNSAMCIDVIGNITMQQIIDTGKKTVFDNMAKTANPGICICCVDELKAQKEIISFGIKAQKEIIKKQEAINLINKYDCIFGKELGGTGQGIIGAVAGIGLRLSGNDGTFRGKIKFPQNISEISVGDFKKEYKIDDVIDFDKQSSLDNNKVLLNDNFAKLLFRNHKKVAFATEYLDGKYNLYNKEDAMNIDSEKLVKGKEKTCEHFVLDNDLNECLTNQENCINCLYRRFTKDGFICDFK